jgi:hypothetical protein
MALKKILIEDNGIQTEYHKILNITVEQKEVQPIRESYEVNGKTLVKTVFKEAYKLNVTVASYTTLETRKKSVSLVAYEKNYIIPVESAQFEVHPIFELAYEELKKTDKFAEAEDC